METITNKESLQKIINNINEEIDVEISGLSPYDILEIMKDSRISISRKGFKKWHIRPKNTNNYTTPSYIVASRIVTLILSMIFFICVTYWLLSYISYFWIDLESKFISLPVAAGLIASMIFTITTVVVKYVIKKDPLTILRTYVGWTYEGKRN